MPPERRHLDLRAAAAAVADGPPEKVTMAGVARALGVAKPTLYRLARSRAELIDACVEAEGERLVEHLHAAFSPDEAGARSSSTARIADALERFAADSPGGFALLFEAAHPRARPAVRRAEDRLRELLRRTEQPSGPGVVLGHQGGTVASGRVESADAAALLGAAAARLRRRREDADVPTPRTA